MNNAGRAVTLFPYALITQKGLPSDYEGLTQLINTIKNHHVQLNMRFIPSITNSTNIALCNHL